MRLLHVVSSTDPAGGGVIEGILQLRQALIAAGHDSEIASLDAPDAKWLENFPAPIHPMGPGKSSYGYTERLVPWLKQHHRDYDIVIADGLWQYSSFGTWRAMTAVKAPYLVYTHGMLDPWFKRQYPLKHLKKALYWPWGEYRVLRDAATVCFTTDEERLLARESFSRYRCTEAVVHYGTSSPSGNPELQQAEFFSKFPQLKGKRLLLFLSRIHPKKGCDLLIKAFAAVADKDQDLHLVIAGPDPLGIRPQLEQLAAQLNVAGKITWPGMLKGDVKWGAFYASEAFVLPSHQENFGIAVAEALACGSPVLISNKVNIWREVENDRAGLVSDDTETGVTDMLLRWQQYSKAERAEIASRASSCFDRRFQMDQAAAALIKVVASVREKNG